MERQERLWSLWLAWLPPLYVLSPLSLMALRSFTSLPRPVRALLGLYAMTQLLPALLAPEPLLAVGLATLRTALTAGLICVGALLADRPGSVPFPLLALGLNAVYLSALILSLLEGRDFLTARLHHPYMTTTTLGVLGAVGLWWSAFHEVRWPARLLTAFLAGGTLLLSGSRGALLAALVGLTVGALARGRWRVPTPALVLTLLAFAGLAWYGARSDFAAVSRLADLSLAGRQVIWHNVRTVIASEPFSGVGPYRLGTRLASPQSCQTFADAREELGCPAWFDDLGQPWLIAHNAALQQWSESGPVGTAGLFLLLGAVTVAAWRGRQPFALATLGGLLVTNLNDNTLLVPGVFTGELFWVLAGTQLPSLRLRSAGLHVGLTGAFLLAALSAPPLLALRPPHLSAPPALNVLYAPGTTAQTEDYTIFASLTLPPGPYLVTLNTCTVSCRAVQTRPVTSAGEPITIDARKLRLLPVDQQRLELLIFPNSGARLGVAASTAWTVRRTPAAPTTP
ncbi:O-antigen ligase family protein [Deinococcus ficus]|uniref:O-antigen ligase family protein n=1 Tax=Deinococcus ficus TaxID=317577 RepID=UPI0004861B61|nr:O-antigen ligase family protein [Deinococcus ficus]